VAARRGRVVSSVPNGAPSTPATTKDRESNAKENILAGSTDQHYGDYASVQLGGEPREPPTGNAKSSSPFISNKLKAGIIASEPVTVIKFDDLWRMFSHEKVKGT